MRTQEPRHENLRKRSCYRTVVTAFQVVALLSLLAGIVHAQSAPMDKVEQAVLAEDWETLANDLLKAVNQNPKESLDPVLRWLKGHACLVLNRNNESVCLFLSVVAPKDLDACRNWSEKLVRNHPKNAMAYYCKADVLARLKKWKDAIAAYNSALDHHRDKNHPLIHNARGVAYAHNQELKRARLDFAMASSNVKFPLADAHANLGAYRIQKKDGAQAALKAFNKSLEISPTFALALHGRGCARFVQGDVEEAVQDLKHAQKEAGCAATMLVESLLDLRPDAGAASREKLQASLENDDPAMSARLAFHNLEQNFAKRGQVSARDLATVVAWTQKASPAGRDHMNNLIAESSRRNPVFGQQIMQKAGQAKMFHAIRDRLKSIQIGPKRFGVVFDVSSRIKGSDIIRGFERSAQNHTLGGKLGTRPDGVKATLAASNWDEGDWPFAPCYGLVYSSAADITHSGRKNKNDGEKK